jgi:hypothetical protein
VAQAVLARETLSALASWGKALQTEHKTREPKQSSASEWGLMLWI